MAETNKSSLNRFIFVPRNIAQAVGKNMVVSPSLHYCRARTASGLFLPNSEDSHHEKKYEIGIVISTGSEVEHIRKGNIVVWQVSRAWRLPNGENKEPELFHLIANGDSVIALMPNPEKVAAGDEEEIAQFNLDAEQIEEIKNWVEGKAQTD